VAASEGGSPFFFYRVHSTKAHRFADYIVRTWGAAVLRPYTDETAQRTLEVEVLRPGGARDFAAEVHALDFDPGDEGEAVEDEPAPFAEIGAVPEHE
jgi:hypothetical protein